MRFAEKFAADYRLVDAAFLAELREHFTDEELGELGMMIGQYISFGRLLVMYGLGEQACEIYPTGD